MGVAIRSSPTGRARPCFRSGDGCPSAESWSSPIRASPRSFLTAALRPHVTFVTRLRLDANLYEPPAKRKPGQKGRPAMKGRRLPKLCDVPANEKTRWTRLVMPYWYGDDRRCVLEIVTGTAVWHHAGLPPAPILWVLVRDPTGVRNPRAFLCTDTDLEPATFLSFLVRQPLVDGDFPSRKAASISASRRNGNGPTSPSRERPRRCSDCSRC